MRSLVIEDEPQIGAYLGRLLGQLRGIVDIVGSLSDAKQALGNFKYDLASVLEITKRLLGIRKGSDDVDNTAQLPKQTAEIGPNLRFVFDHKRAHRSSLECVVDG